MSTLESRPIAIAEVPVRGYRSLERVTEFGAQRAMYTYTGESLAELGYDDLDRTLRTLMPDVVKPLTQRMTFDKLDFTLYVNREFKESVFLWYIEPASVRLLMVWPAEWSPISYPCRRGKFVVAIETK